MVLIAAAGAPLALAVAFAAADLAFFATTFTQFRISNPWVQVHLMRPSIALREAALLAVIAWAVWAVVSHRPGSVTPLSVAEPEPVPALAGAPE
jgi:hypothetical protein